jgi:hypothetical protein
MQQTVMTRTAETGLYEEEAVLLDLLQNSANGTITAESAAAATGLARGLCALALDLLDDRGVVDLSGPDDHPSRGTFALR